MSFWFQGTREHGLRQQASKIYELTSNNNVSDAGRYWGRRCWLAKCCANSGTEVDINGWFAVGCASAGTEVDVKGWVVVACLNVDTVAVMAGLLIVEALANRS